MEQQKPIGFEDYLSAFGPVMHDSYCGEPVAWGFKITKYLGEELFGQLSRYGTMECIDRYKSSWALVTKTLNREEAIVKYGTITDEDFGPRGGWRSTTFGNKKFSSKFLRPEKH